MKRAVSLLQVADVTVWAELSAMGPLEAHIERELSAAQRVVKPSFTRSFLPLARDRGLRVLERYARRDRAEMEAATHDLEERLAALGPDARRVLASAQRHAQGGVVLGAHAWDPLEDAPSVRALHGAGLIEHLPDDAPPHAGRYRLHRDLPELPAPPYDFAEAVMDVPDDLEASKPGPIDLLHDLASLAAAIEATSPRRTHAGTVAKIDARRLLERVGADGEALESHPRWGRALRGLEALHAVAQDPVSRELHLDLGLESTLAGEVPDAVDHLVRRLVEADLHPLLPALRCAFRQAGTRALDEVVFLELLRDQHRDVLFPAWHREGAVLYPVLGGDAPRPLDDDNFERIEAKLCRTLFSRLSRLGLLRRAEGVFAATPDGLHWAGLGPEEEGRLWASSDLELIVPPHALTPWERFQVERLARLLTRDVVDRYRLERTGLEKWLSTHDLEEALALLRRRTTALPTAVVATLETWARSALRVVLVHGVVVEE